jgi:hypothetical protein
VIVVASTLCAFAMGAPHVWGSWLRHAEAMHESHPTGVRFFCAIETDDRRLAPFAPLLDRLAAVDGEHWTFALDDGRTSVTTANRLRHITTGQNLVTDYACATGASHLLFLAADCEPPSDAIPKLLEVDWPIVGGHVPTYCLDGPEVPGYPFPVRRHMATAAFVMLRRDLFRVMRWRWDLDTGMSDDPCLYWDAKRHHGYETYVRHDCVGTHHPAVIPAIEHRGYDLTVMR